MVLTDEAMELLARMTESPEHMQEILIKYGEKESNLIGLYEVG